MQKSPYIFTGYDIKFCNYSAGENRYQVRFSRNIAVGTESSLWESLLNFDLRGH